MNVFMGTAGIEITSLDGQGTITILSQLELFAVIDMLSEAMAGIAGEYHESEEFIVPAEMQDKIDLIMACIFGSNDEKTDEANHPENTSKTGCRKVLPDDN